MFDWEWRWFSAYIWKKNSWGLGFNIAAQKEYAYISAHILKWEFNFQWEGDYSYVRG